MELHPCLLQQAFQPAEGSVACLVAGFFLRLFDGHGLRKMIHDYFTEYNDLHCLIVHERARLTNLDMNVRIEYLLGQILPECILRRRFPVWGKERVNAYFDRYGD